MSKAKKKARDPQEKVMEELYPKGIHPDSLWLEDAHLKPSEPITLEEWSLLPKTVWNPQTHRAGQEPPLT